MTVRSNSAAARDIAYHLHSYTNARKNEAEGPMVITHGKGVYVYDENGKAYIEGLSGLWCLSLGYGEERLVEAAASQMRKLPYYHTFTQKVADLDVLLDPGDTVTLVTSAGYETFVNDPMFEGVKSPGRAELTPAPTTRPGSPKTPTP